MWRALMQWMDGDGVRPRIRDVRTRPRSAGKKLQPHRTLTTRWTTGHGLCVMIESVWCARASQYMQYDDGSVCVWWYVLDHYGMTAQSAADGVRLWVWGFMHDLCAFVQTNYAPCVIMMRNLLLRMHICMFNTWSTNLFFADRAFFVTFHMALEAEQQGRADVSVSPDFSEMPEDRHIEFQVSFAGYCEKDLKTLWQYTSGGVQPQPDCLQIVSFEIQFIPTVWRVPRDFPPISI